MWSGARHVRLVRYDAQMDTELRPKTKKRRETIGELFLAVPAVQEMVKRASEDLASGLPQETVRERIAERAQTSELTVSRVLLPALSRKSRRMSLRAFLHLLAEKVMSSTRNRTLGEAIDGLGEQLGFTPWLADMVLHAAATGEASPMFDYAVGKVAVWDMGIEGPPGSMTVWAVATPMSDPRELAREFVEKCVEVFPDHTWSRYAGNAEAASYVRRRIQGATFEQIAEEELGVEELAHLNALGPAVRKARVGQEADRIRHAFDRFVAYLDSFEDGTVR